MVKNTLENIKSLISYLKKDTRLTVLLGIIIITLLIIVRPALQTREEPAEVSFKIKQESDQKNLSEIVYEKDLYKDNAPAFGKQIERKRSGEYVEYSHGNNKEDFHHKVDIGVKKDGTIKYAFYEIWALKKFPLEFYKNKFNLEEPDKKMYILDREDEIANIYLDEGIMLYVRESDTKVSHEMYFNPMSLNEFLDLWGDRLSEEIPRHHEDEPNGWGDF